MRQNLFVLAAMCLFILTSTGPAAGLTVADGPITIDQPISGLYAKGDTITFSGRNTGSGTTYLFITGPGLNTNGAQIRSTHPGQSPVIDGDASTFQAAGVGSDNRWSFTWDTRNIEIGTGSFTIYAASTPRDLPHLNNTQSGRISFLKLSESMRPFESYEPIIITRPERQSISRADILPSPSVVREGNKIRISGRVNGNPPPGSIVVWYMAWDSDTVKGGGSGGWTIVEPDSTGSYFQDIIDSQTIGRIEEGNYHVVIQHPMQNNVFDIYQAPANETGPSWIWNRMLKENNNAEGSKIYMDGGLHGNDAYLALIEAFRDPGVDDIIAIAPPPAVTQAGPGNSVPVVNSADKKTIAQTREGLTDTESAAGSSFEVDTVVVDPPGDLASGTPVTVSYRVNISGTGTDETFPAADELQMSTGLEKPRWEYTLVLDGVENIQPGSNGRMLSVSGWVLSYPSSSSEYLKVTLSGTTPRVSSPANVTLFTVTEYDSRGDRIAGSEISRTARNNPGTGQPALPGTGVQANPAVPVTSGGTMIEKIRAGFSNANGAPAGISRADRYSGNTVDECSLVPFKDPGRPLADGFTWENASVFNFGTAADYSSPFGKEETRIPVEQAKELVKKAFPDYAPDRIDMEFDEGHSFRVWKFDLYKDEKQLVYGGLDSRTGELMYYHIPFFYRGDTQERPDPAITMESARLAAENEIRERNGVLPLKLMDSEVYPSGNYVFDYRRLIQGVPSFSNGIHVGIDARTGKVGLYTRGWSVPENAVAASSVPAISREQATALVEREAKSCYPESAYSFRIVSADLQWMDSYPADKFIPKPGVIPLAWHVRFNDKTIRAEDLRRTDDVWVDAQNGTLLSMEYFHRR
jgi:predicted transcriptional regulator with HTH domain